MKVGRNLEKRKIIFQQEFILRSPKPIYVFSFPRSKGKGSSAEYNRNSIFIFLYNIAPFILSSIKYFSVYNTCEMIGYLGICSILFHQKKKKIKDNTHFKFRFLSRSPRGSAPDNKLFCKNLQPSKQKKRIKSFTG